jgi:predicted Zn-dependent protease
LAKLSCNFKLAFAQVCHEISHVTQHQITRAIAAMSRDKVVDVARAASNTTWEILHGKSPIPQTQTELFKRVARSANNQRFWLLEE